MSGLVIFNPWYIQLAAFRQLSVFSIGHCQIGRTQTTEIATIW